MSPEQAKNELLGRQKKERKALNVEFTEKLKGLKVRAAGLLEGWRVGSTVELLFRERRGSWWLTRMRDKRRS